MEIFWPELDVVKGRQNLYVALHYIRKKLEPEINSVKDSMYIISQHGSYKFNIYYPYRLDLEDFEKYYHEGNNLFHTGNLKEAEIYYLKAPKKSWPLIKGGMEKMKKKLYTLITLSFTVGFLMYLVAGLRSCGLVQDWVPFRIEGQGFFYTPILYILIAIIFLLMWTLFIKRRVRDKIKESEEFAIAILNNLPQSVAVLDIEGNVIETNYLWKNFFEFYSTSDKCAFCKEGVNYFEMCHRFIEPEEKVLNTIDSIKKVISGESKKFVLEYPGFSRDDTLWFSMKVVPLSNNYPTRVMVIHADISAQKRVEEEIRKSEEKYRVTFENSGIPLMVVEEDTTISMVNEQFELLLEYNKEELIGMSWTKFAAQQDVKRMIEYHYSRRKNRPGIPKRYETHFITKNGKIIDVLLTANLIKQTNQTIASLLDITPLKIMEKNLRDSKTKIERLHEIALKMEKCQVEEEIYRLIIEAAEGILNFSFCVVDSIEDNYFITKATSSQININEVRKFPITDGLGAKTVRTKKTYLVDDLRKDKDARPVKSEYRSAISAPVGDVGIFQVVSNEVGAFNSEDVKLTEILLAHAAVAIKRIRSENKIKYISFHDSLTGLYNRAFFEEELKRLDTERQLPLSIIIGDINSLKLVNDVFGHDKGDEYITQIAQILKKSVRKEDIVARWGGDEFAILLPHTEEKAAFEICAKVKDSCEQINSTPIKPTIALGAAVKLNGAQNINDIIKEAENRMYKNKLDESRRIRGVILKSIQKTLREKSCETEEHFKGLIELINYFEVSLHLPLGVVRDLKLLATLHDIGNITIPEEVLKKAGPLTEVEWEMIKRHPEAGYRIAKTTPEFGSIADAILSHHEWWDGSGYPEGLKGEEIPLSSRMLAIIDAFDVMTNDRPYKKTMTVKEALLELKRCSGTQFDPHLVEVFVKEYVERNKIDF